MGPIDYSIDVQTPFQSALQGFQGGAGIRQVMDQRAALQSQQAQQQQLQEELYAASQDPSRLPGVMVRYPQLAEKLKHGWDAMTSDQQQSALTMGGQVLSALESGNPAIASDLLRNKAEGQRNSGDEQGAKLSETMAQWAEQSPDTLKASTYMRMAAIPGGEKMIKSILDRNADRRAEDKAPIEVRQAEANAQSAEAKAQYAPQSEQAVAVKAVADAQTSQVKAKFAESDAVSDLEKKGWDIKKIQADIDINKQNSRIAAMNAATSREGNTLKRQELSLKLNEAITKRDDAIRKKANDAEEGAATIDNMLNTVQRIRGNKSLNDVLGSIEGRLPSVISDEGADAIALIDTLQSQAFLTQFDKLKGSGQITEIEGDKATKALQNLSRTQSEGQFKANLAEVERVLMKTRAGISKASGIPLGAPDVPAAKPGGSSGRSASGVVTHTIKSDADYNALPSGATFVAPDGTTRKKP